MNATPRSLPLTAARRVDAVCDRFEAAWQAGGAPPRIEDYLAGTGPEADALLRELVLLEAHYRRRAGEAPSTLDYQERFPALDPTWLRGALAPDDSARTAAPGGHTGPAVETVAGYELLGELGRGGMGVVYKARQLSLNRLVALKVIRSAAHASADERDRFRREAEAVARFRHPNIVTVYEIGEHAGQPYFALELVEGGTLAGRLAASPLPPAEAARLTAVLARAIHHAHEMGIVHRDLKPANILLQIADCGSQIDRQESRAPAFRSAICNPQAAIPKITDFGLAKRLDADGPGTVTGALVGTPSYMAPEQASASKDVGPLADVYALGAILYECLTGRPPFKGADLLDTLQQVRFSEPVAVRALQPRCPRDLEIVALKCLQKEPGRRYATAQALADDLERFAGGRPVQARAVPWWERAWKWARRNRAVAALSAAVATAVLMGLALVSWQWQEAVSANALKDEALGELQEREGRLVQQAAELAKQTGLAESAAGVARRRADEAGRARAEAERRLEAADRSDYRVRLGLGQRELENNQIHAARAALDGCRWDLCEFEHRYLHGVGQRRLRAAWHTGSFVRGLAVSKDGRFVATAGYWNGGTGQPGQVQVWRADTGAAVWAFRGHTALANGVAFSPDGKRLASAGGDWTVRIWDLESGKLARALRPDAAAHAVAFSPDGARLAAYLSDGSVRLYLTETWAEERSLQAAPRPEKGRLVSSGPNALAFSPDGARLATANPAVRPAEPAELVVVWDVKTGEKALSLKVNAGPRAVAYSPDGRYLAAAGAGVQVFEAQQGRPVTGLAGSTLGSEAVAFSADGRRLAVGGGDHAVTVWDVPTRQKLLTLPGHSGAVAGLAFTHGGRLASGGDETVRVWQTEADIAAVKLQPTLFTRVLAFHPDGRRVARVLTGAVAVVDASTGETLRLFKGRGGLPSATLVFSPDGKRLAAGGSAATGKPVKGKPNTGAVKVWDVAGGDEVLSLTNHAGAVSSVTFSRDGKLLVTASGGRRGNKEVADVKVWDAATGQLLASCQGLTRPVKRVAISPDGRMLATADQGPARLWDAATGQPLRYLSRPASGWCGCVAFSPDSRRVVTGHDDGQMFVWSAADGRELLAMSGHSDAVTDVTFSPDGQRLASASGVGDRGIRLWDAATGEMLLALAGHTRAVVAVTFSPDGQRLFSRGLSNELKAWDATARPAIRPLPETRHQVFVMRLRPDGRAMATAGKDGEVKLWDLTRGRVAQTLAGHRHRVLTLAYSPDSTRLVTAGGGTGKEPELKVWDAAGKELFALGGHPMWVSAAAFSPDGQRLVTGGVDGMTKVWDARSGRELRSFPWGKRGAASLAFSPDGAVLAGGGRDGKLRLWTADGRLVRETATIGPYTSISDVAFHPDGTRIAGACSDRVVRVWDVVTGGEVLALRGHLGPARGVAYRAGGKQIVTAGEDAILRVWDAATGAPLFALSQEAVARGLSPHYADGQVGGDWRVFRMAKAKDRYVDGVTGRVFSAPEPIIQARFAALGISADGRTLAASALQCGAALYDLDALAPRPGEAGR